MKRMAHPDNPKHIVEADEGRARMLASTGWNEVKPAAKKAPAKKSAAKKPTESDPAE